MLGFPKIKGLRRTIDSISHREGSTVKGTTALNNICTGKLQDILYEYNVEYKGYGAGRWWGNNAIETAIKIPVFPNNAFCSYLLGSGNP